jgi:hypothetical protein
LNLVLQTGSSINSRQQRTDVSKFVTGSSTEALSDATPSIIVDKMEKKTTLTFRQNRVNQKSSVLDNIPITAVRLDPDQELLSKTIIPTHL